MPKYTKENTEAVGIIPRNFNERVAVRIKDVKDKDSAAGNPMITWECEIIHPDSVEIDGQKYVIAGQEFKMYYPLVNVNGDQVPKLIFTIHPKLSLPEELDTDNLKDEVLKYVDICFDMMLTSKDRQALVKNEKQQLVPKIDPETKKPIVMGVEWNPQFDNIIGLSKHTSENPM